jgi:hypothetical protein
VNALFAITLALATQSAPAFDDVAWGSDRALSLEGGVEGGSFADVFVPHGWGRLRYHDEKVLPGLHVDVDLNTDTLELSLVDPAALGGQTYARVFGRFQAFAAQLLYDYARDGEQIDELAFTSGYAMLGGVLARDIARRGWAHLTAVGDLTARQWFHAANGGTGEGFALPAPMTALELGGTLVLESHGPQGPFRRRKGAWAMTRGELLARMGQASWGQLGALDDGRNDVDDPLGMRGIAKAGFAARGSQLGVVRPGFMVEGTAASGVALDDRYRFLVGGENPWVERVAGLGWAEYLADQYGKVHVETALEVDRWVMLILGVDVLVVQDPARSGDKDQGTIAGAFVEVQTRPWDSVWLRLRAARAAGARRAGGDAGLKWLAHLEWRPYVE